MTLPAFIIGVWSILGLLIFCLWYIATPRPSARAVWFMAFLCGPASFGLILCDWLNGNNI